MGERLQGGFFYSGCLYVVVGTCVEKVETGASPVWQLPSLLWSQGFKIQLLRRGRQHWNPWGAAQAACWAIPPGLRGCEGPQNCKQCVLQPAEEKSRREQKISVALDGFRARAALSEEQVYACRRGIIAKLTWEVNWMDSLHESQPETGTGALGHWKTGPAAAKCCCFEELLVGDTQGDGAGGDWVGRVRRA